MGSPVVSHLDQSLRWPDNASKSDGDELKEWIQRAGWLCMHVVIRLEAFAFCSNKFFSAASTLSRVLNRANRWELPDFSRTCRSLLDARVLKYPRSAWADLLCTKRDAPRLGGCPTQVAFVALGRTETSLQMALRFFKAHDMGHFHNQRLGMKRFMNQVFQPTMAQLNETLSTILHIPIRVCLGHLGKALYKFHPQKWMHSSQTNSGPRQPLQQAKSPSRI